MRHRRYNARKRKFQKGVRFWSFEIAAALLVAAALVFFCMQIVFVHGHTMKPSYDDGDLVLVNKISYRLGNPKRMDVILFKVKSGEIERTAMGRVVGLPGEHVQIVDGRFCVNGKELPLKSDILIKTPGEAQEVIDLGEDEYFVLCDNYNSGEDSRMASIGNVKKEQIVGKIVWNLIRNKE